MSKIIENIVLRQPFSCLNCHDLLCPSQSAYRPCHSTETALLKITNDILRALDGGAVVVLTVLGLFSAFDTIDHYILLHRLRSRYGISGTVFFFFGRGLSLTLLVGLRL